VIQMTSGGKLSSGTAGKIITFGLKSSTVGLIIIMNTSVTPRGSLSLVSQIDATEHSAVPFTSTMVGLLKGQLELERLRL